MLELAGMLPTLLVLSMLPSVRLRLSQRLKLMLVFSMEPMDMVLVLDMLDLDMDIPVLDMLDMVVMDLAVLAMLVLATMARGLLMLSQRLMLVCTMEDIVMDSDTVLDADVSSMVKQFSYASKSSKVIF